MTAKNAGAPQLWDSFCLFFTRIKEKAFCFIAYKALSESSTCWLSAIMRSCRAVCIQETWMWVSRRQRRFYNYERWLKMKICVAEMCVYKSKAFRRSPHPQQLKYEWNCSNSRVPKSRTRSEKRGQINGAFCFHLPSSPVLPRSSFPVSSSPPVPQPTLLLLQARLISLQVDWVILCLPCFVVFVCLSVCWVML